MVLQSVVTSLHGGEAMDWGSLNPQKLYYSHSFRRKSLTEPED